MLNKQKGTAAVFQAPALQMPPETPRFFQGKLGEVPKEVQELIWGIPGVKRTTEERLSFWGKIIK